MRACNCVWLLFVFDCVVWVVRFVIFSKWNVLCVRICCVGCFWLVVCVVVAVVVVVVVVVVWFVCVWWLSLVGHCVRSLLFVFCLLLFRVDCVCLCSLLVFVFSMMCM